MMSLLLIVTIFCFTYSCSYFTKKEYTFADAQEYNKKGLEYYRKGFCKEAVYCFSRAIEIEPDFAGFFSNRGYAYMKMEEYVKATADYNRAIELNPCDATFFSNRGRAYGILGKYELAFKDFEKAIEIDKEYSITYANSAQLYEKLKNYKEAIEDYRKYIKYEHREKEEKAVKHVRRKIEILEGKIIKAEFEAD